ncbi:glutathione S-transferase family protein [Paraferrimonas sedimenticola]|uniref:Glutathione S-transferase n=1 Tax=Paraferrimonas sedimenticola TaxID=375674 RepID=A0AA37W101_9GAMM|nr:glutathione S-transferase family protein [Paraferrimonas sedimenticola]GLP96418.1 hypothetical protein GCM10007895_17240 [Paraferrimonas sedimenticola]
MQLLSSDLSPYSTRVRILVRKYGLPIEIVAPDLPLRTPEFLAKYPLGKIPVLVLDNGQQIPESWAIMSFLEQTYSLVERSPLEQARINTWVRYADLHLAPAVFGLFAGLLRGEATNTEAEIAAIKAQLAKGNALLAQDPELTDRPVDIADIAVAPVMFFVLATPKAMGLDLQLQDYPLLHQWWQKAQADADIAQGLQEVENAFAKFTAPK